MSKLIIDRRSEFANRGRKIGLYLNEKKIGTIENGQTKEFEIEPGNYNLHAKIDWCGSQKQEILLKENESKKVELTGFPKNKWILPILILIQLVLVGLTYLIDINKYIMMIYSLGVLIYIFYPITFGRNNYLKLIER
ncbi:hypothetical protein [uncultured Salegentibacter sp.]|uniref:hypothetical protein n=1 Tax=uncultured Salegentibacter sp. TaxID=259320 RepID=UPI0025989DE2|nr:hypothetical protein [uncultured Salegentibacter sp.]